MSKKSILATPEQVEKIARRYCENQGLHPESITSGGGLMGNAMTQPLWRFSVPQVLRHLQMVDAVRSVLDPVNEPVVSGPDEISGEERDRIHAAIRDTMDRAVRDNDFLGETLRRRAEHSAASTALSVQEEADSLIARTPAGVAAHFFPTPAARVVDPIRKEYAPVQPPREQLVLEEVVRRLVELAYRG